MDPGEKFAMSLDYIFGRGVGGILPLNRLEFSFSKRTGRLKTVYLEGRLIATIRSDGSIALTLHGAELLAGHPEFSQNCVTVQDEVEEYVAKGYSVFAKHVVNCGGRVRPASDVVVLDAKGSVIAVGKAVLSAKMMKAFKKGVAVKIREAVGR